MSRDEEIVKALNEIDNYKNLLIDEKTHLEECLNGENIKFLKDCGKTLTNVGALVGKTTALFFGVVFSLAFINSLGIPAPYVYIVKGIPIGIQNYLIIFRDYKDPFKVKFSLKTRKEVKDMIKDFEVNISMMDKIYSDLFSKLSLEKMNELVHGFEYESNEELDMIPPKTRSRKLSN